MIVHWEPRDYQGVIRDYVMSHPRCNVWCPMGGGKTVSTLTALDIVWLCGSKFRPVLVLAPKRVAVSVWPAEAKKWDHLKDMRISVIAGTPEQRAAAVEADADVYTINYENIPWLVEYCGDEWPFMAVMADESTHLKNFKLRKGGVRSTALSMVAKRTGRWVNLTGTLIPNGLLDLWGQQWFVDFGERLGRTYTAFKDRWFTTNPYTRKTEALPFASEQIMERLSDVTLIIPPIVIEQPVRMEVPVTLPPHSRTLYSDMEDEMFMELGGLEVEAFTAAAKSQKCWQIANGAIYTNPERTAWSRIHDVKLDAMKDIIDETNGQPLIVVYQFRHDLERLKAAFPHARELRTTKDEDDWNAGNISMLVGHPKSMGHGLNLQDGGCIVVFFSMTWNLEHHDQVIERVGPLRQLQSGHPRPVLVYYIMATDTVDYAMRERLIEKASVQDALRSYRRAA